MEKIQYSASDISITKLSEDDKEQLKAFSCSNDPKFSELNSFIQGDDVFLSNFYHYFSVYVVRLRSTLDIVALFSLASDSIVLYYDEDKQNLKEDVAVKVKKEYSDVWQQQTSFPAINIGHLAVKEEFRRKGIGTILLDFVIATFSKFDTIGCQFVTVDALNNKQTNSFYIRNYFDYLTNSDNMSSTRRMYFILRSIVSSDDDC